MLSRRRHITFCILLGVIFFCTLIRTGAQTISGEFPIANTRDTATQYYSEIASSAAFDGTNYLVGFEEDVRLKSHCTNAASTAIAQFVSPSGKIGSPIPVGTTGGTPQVAFDRTNYLMVWQELKSPTYSTHILGQLVAPNGTLVGSQITVPTGNDTRLGASLNCFLFDGANYFVVWQDNSTAGNADTSEIFGQFISPSGSLLGSRILISTSPAVNPTLAFDGTNILVAWVDGRNQSACYTDSHKVQHCHESDIYGQFVTGSSAGSPGSLLNGNFPVSTSSLPRDNPITAAFDSTGGTNYLITFTEETTLPNACPSTGCKWNAYGQFVTTAPGAPTGSKITISNTAPSHFPAGAVWVGNQYLAAWTENFGTAASVIKGRYFDGSGNPLGPEFIVFSKNSAGQIPLFPFILPEGQNYFAVINRGSSANLQCSANMDVYGAFINATVPGAPREVSATAGTGQAIINFSAPASDGGSAITGYTVTSNPADGVDSDAGSTSTTHTVTNLKNGTAYTFRVNATNQVGTGLNSASSNKVTPGYASLTVTITPDTAVKAGAQWCVNDAGSENCGQPSFNGPWQKSGATVKNLTVGSYTLGFNAVSGWVPPENRTIKVKQGHNEWYYPWFIYQLPSFEPATAECFHHGGGCKASPCECGTYCPSCSWADGVCDSFYLKLYGTACGAVGAQFTSYQGNASGGTAPPTAYPVSCGGWSTRDVFNPVQVYNKDGPIVCARKSSDEPECAHLEIMLRILSSPGEHACDGNLGDIQSSVWGEVVEPNIPGGSEFISERKKWGASSFHCPGSGKPTCGSLTVTIDPPEAAGAGAQWNVDGGGMKNSGDKADQLTDGDHTVSFSTVDGWTAPKNKTVKIVAGQTASTVGTYVPKPESLSFTFEAAQCVYASGGCPQPYPTLGWMVYTASGSGTACGPSGANVETSFDSVTCDQWTVGPTANACTREAGQPECTTVSGVGTVSGANGCPSYDPHETATVHGIVNGVYSSTGAIPIPMCCLGTNGSCP